mmetsp:Transcript_32296/g.70979  ORF Transcript_32296/g.70979 Transcript_32296/m.70979 type:complete len:288 (+) Transcript_32296:161-1024(+)
MRTKLVLAALTTTPSTSSKMLKRPSHVPAECVIAGLPYWHETSDYPRQPLPTRNGDGCLSFPDHPSFRPSLSPREMFRAGAFGGTYYRPIASKTAKCSYDVGVHLEFPPDWFEGLDISHMVTSEVYRKEVNKYGVKSGNDLNFWETKGWMREQDPYGWVQWYCRFYLGRRTEDDIRQVSRWVKAIGDKGRWRTFLVGQCVKSGKAWDDYTASPVTRQTLLHWGYELTEEEFDRLAGPIRKGKSIVYLGKVANSEDQTDPAKDANTHAGTNRSTRRSTRKSKRQKKQR